MILTTAVPTSRKRRRRQGTAAATASPSTTTTELPRVTTAPASLPTHKGGATLSRRVPPSTPKPFTDSSDLEAQISTLSLIQTHGYGPVPGTPKLRGKASNGSPSAERFRIMSGARDGATINGAVGQGSATGGRGIARGRSLGGKRPNNVRSHASSRASIREPWLGPMDSGAGLKGQHHVSCGKVKGCTYYCGNIGLAAAGSHCLYFVRSYTQQL